MQLYQGMGMSSDPLERAALLARHKRRSHLRSDGFLELRGSVSTQLHLSLWPCLSQVSRDGDIRSCPQESWDLYYMLFVYCAVTCSDAFLKQSKSGNGWSLLCLMSFLSWTQVKQSECWKGKLPEQEIILCILPESFHPQSLKSQVSTERKNLLN